MTTLFRLHLRANEVTSDLFAKRREAEASRPIENAAAVAIQGWYRGHRVRSYIRHLHQCAQIIQKTFRAHIARAVYREKLLVQLEKMRQQFYNASATLIQKRWRGYYVRKYIFDFYARKEYLKALQDNNEIIRNELEIVKLKEEERKRKEKEEKLKAKKELASRRKHYLISTAVIPSIYNSPYQRGNLMPKELELRQVKPLSKVERDVMEEEHWIKTVESGVIDMYGIRPAGHGHQGSLPPLQNTKLQGPFRDPVTVKMQRYKPLCPSLRVATSYNSVEEARAEVVSNEYTRRVIDQRFVPFAKTTNVYQPLIHKESPYIRNTPSRQTSRARDRDRPAYGTKHFREEDLSRHVSNQPFKRLVSPVPVFDQLGNTY